VHRRLGNLRLLIVIAALIALWFCLHDQAFSAWWLLVPVAVFIATAAYHAQVLRSRTQAERAVDVYRKGLARIEDRWPGNGQQATPVDIGTHLYATDLDIFGPSSLFELLSLARTRMGEETLANWLLAPATIAQIIGRQSAVTELRTRLDLREDMATLGPIQGKDLKAGVHPEALSNWAEASNQLTNPWLRWLALALALAAIAAAIAWAELGTKSPFFAIIIIEGAITALHLKRIKQIFHSTEHALEDLQLLSSLLARLESEPFETPLLQSLKQQLSSHHIAGSKAIAHLKTIVEYIYSLDNPIVKMFDIPLMYSVQVAYAAESWRRSHGTAVRSWLRTIGEIEALLSLSAFSYEHPADPFPELLAPKENSENTPPTFTAQALGHPLIPAARCVRNNISIAAETRVLLISGSNMSGKSTLMRAIGINTVLAMAGAPVRAQRLQLTALQVGASILINDSLQEGSSRFYAEITRLRHLCDLATKTPPLLFLLDELLQGTNSKDRLIGAEGTVRALLDAGAIGLISTHDLALTNIAANDPRLHNVHLQDDIVDGKMHFDFKLHEGVVTRSNGIELMRLIGLKV
jgi:DNA mismatch repair ATPase MutS